MIEELGGDFLQWLRGFYFVAKRQSVTKATFDMGRNQSTITHQVQCLEREFGVTLFDRSRGKMELTPEGEALLEKAISVFEIVQEMKGKFSKSDLEASGKVVIAASHAIIYHYLPRFIARFRENSPKVTFELEGGGAEMILSRIQSAESDFGIASLDKVSDDLFYHDLFSTSLHLVAPKNNPFFSEKEPNLETIAEAPVIFFPKSSTIVPLIEALFSENNLKLNVALVLNNFESVKKYVELGIGLSILDSYTVNEEDEDRFDIYPLERFFGRRKYGLIIRKQKYHAPQVRAFINSIRPEIQL